MRTLRARKPERDYLLATFTTGGTPYLASSTNASLSFDYSYQTIQGISNYRSATSVLQRHNYVPSWSGSIEMGRSTGFAFSAEMGRLSLGDNQFATHIAFTLGYNFPVGREWIFQPSIGESNIISDINFPITIDNVNKNVVIGNDVFPYLQVFYSKGGPRNVYSDYTVVGLNNTNDGVLFQCSIRSNPLRRLSFGAICGVGLYSKSARITVHNDSLGREYPIDDPFFHFQSSSPAERLLNCDGVFFKLNVSYSLVPRRIYRSNYQ